MTTSLARRMTLIATLAMAMLWAEPVAAADPKVVLAKALTKMGGVKRIKKIKTLAIALKSGSVKEFHLIRLAGRMSCYRAERPSGRRLEIVLARGSGFVVDRERDGKVREVENLTPQEIKEAGYDRDLFLMPLLLPELATRDEVLLRAAGQAPNGDPLIDATVPPAPGTAEVPIRYTLRFDAKTHVLIGSKSTIPSGPHAGRTRRVVYRGYQPTGGVLLPRELKYKVDDEPTRSLEFNIKLDTKLPVTLFVKPRMPKPEEKAGDGPRTPGDSKKDDKTPGSSKDKTDDKKDGDTKKDGDGKGVLPPPGPALPPPGGKGSGQ